MSCEEDFKQLLEWCTVKSEKSKAEALYVLGLYYQDGKIVVKDLKKAFEWFKRALENGCEEAIDKLETYFKDSVILPVEGDLLLSSWQFHEAKEFFEKGLKKGLTNSRYHYGLGEALYRMGRYKEALEYFETVLKLHSECLDLMHLKSYRSSLSRKAKILKLLNINQDKLQSLKEMVKDGKLCFNMSNQNHSFDALILLLLENYPITRLKFFSEPFRTPYLGWYGGYSSFYYNQSEAKKISLDEIETLLMALKNNHTITYLCFDGQDNKFSSKKLELIIKNLRTSYTLQKIDYCTNGDNHVDSIKTIDEYLKRNKDYPGELRKEILKSFAAVNESRRMNFPLVLQNLVCTYTCTADSTESVIKLKS